MFSSTAIFAKSLRHRSHWLAVIALAGGIYFLLAIAALHLLAPGLSPVTQMISAYAVGQFGFLQSTAFLAWGAGAMALAVALRATLIPSRSATVGTSLLAIAGLCMFINGIVPCDFECNNTTTLGTLHSILAFPFFFGNLVATLVLLRAYSDDPRWRPFHGTAVKAAAFVVIAFAVFFGQQASHMPFTGVTQRLTAAAVLLSFLLVANHVRAVEPDGV